jgi:tetratricopeptide (TPR) repeat protein
MTPDPETVALIARGNEARSAGHLSLAESDYRLAASRNPDAFSPWYNLGLLYKQQRHWLNAHDSFYRARARLTPEITIEFYAALCWNLGISATITENWPEAHESWRRLGYVVSGDRRLAPNVANLPGLLYLLAGAPVRLSMLDPVRGREHSTGRVHVRDAQRISSSDAEAVYPILHSWD